jgi:hypothetical protein
MQSPKPPASALPPARRLVRLGGLALALALLGIGLLSPARAPARAATVRRGVCTRTAKHAKHSAKTSRCKRAARHAKPVAKKRAKQSHPAGGAAHEGTGAPSQTPALCEDSSAPVRTSSGAYACRDGSEPACEAGGEPTTGPGGAPVCATVAEAPSETGESCTTAGECESAEVSCESGSATAEVAALCESSDDGESVS